MLRPAQEQRWNPIEGFRPALASERAQKELRAWALIAVGALALAGVFALLLAISRLPGADALFPWPVAFYEKSLIIHVVFSFVVWFVACGAIFMQIAAYRLSDGAPMLEAQGRTAAAAATVAFALLAVPALLDRGLPSLNNYVPAIIDPIFYVGLLFIAFSAIAPAVRALTNAANRTGPLEPLGASGLAAGAIGIIAVTAFALSWNRAGGMPTTPAGNEDIFWAGGHILQFFNTAVMIGAWYLLGGRALDRPPVTPKFAVIGLGVMAALSAGGFALQFVEVPFSAEERELFTLYQYALAPVPSVLGLMMVAALFAAPKPESDAAKTAKATLIVSLALFFIGGFLGLFVDGADTRTPAHYHGVIGAVNIALMGFIYLFVLPVLERGLVRWRWAKASVWLYGIGQILHSVGLFVAGGYGAPRKVAGTSPGIDELTNWAGHVGIGIGGVIAVIGGVLFIWISGKRLLEKRN